VQNGVTGEIYRCKDVEGLTRVLQRLLSGDTTIEELSENARNRMKTWSPREAIAGLLEGVEKAVTRVRKLRRGDGSQTA
jgi:hypothetical protein